MENPENQNLPSDIEAEKELLACLIHQNCSVSDVSHIINKDDFSNETTGGLYGIICSIDLPTEPVYSGDVRCVLEEVNDEVSRRELIELFESLPQISAKGIYIEHLCKRIWHKSVFRKGIKHCSQLHNLCSNDNSSYRTDDDTYKKIIDTVEAFRLDIKPKEDSSFIGEHNDEDILESPLPADIEESQEEDERKRSCHSYRIQHISDAVDEAFASIEEVYGSPSYLRSKGIKSQFYELDEGDGVFPHPGLILIAGEQGVGKNTFCLNVLLKHAATSEAHTMIFNQTKASNNLCLQMLAIEAKVDINRIMKQKDWKAGDWDSLTAGAAHLCDSNITIESSNSFSVSTIQKIVNDFNRPEKRNIDIILIDELYLLDLLKEESGKNPIEQTLELLQQLAFELKTTIFVCMDLPVSNNAPPSLADLQKIGNIGQYANTIIFVHKKNVEDDQTTDIIVAKNQTGGTGSSTLFHDKEIGKFYSPFP